MFLTHEDLQILFMAVCMNGYVANYFAAEWLRNVLHEYRERRITVFLFLVAVNTHIFFKSWVANWQQ
jgi:hypothetical protein